MRCIRPYGQDDLPLLRDLLGDPAMTRFIGGPESEEAIVARHERYLAADPQTNGLFTILLQGVAVGWVGFWESEWDGTVQWECGWHLKAPYQGRGIATTATHLALDQARARGSHRFVDAFPSVDNQASNALCARLGFRDFGEVEVEYPKGHMMQARHWRFDLEEKELFEFLCEVNRRPEPFAEYTARELWTDPHISPKMLAFHLDPAVDAASRNHEFVDRSVDWMVSHLGLVPGSRVADFGCGPGLYAQRLARRGADVLGIDFSANSLRYACDEAVRDGLQIEYVQADYLEFETERRFDLIIMIMCDLCALSPRQRAVLLGTFRSLLAPDGRILLDVYSPAMLDAREETASYALDLMDGFWSPEPYFGFLNTFKYERESVLLDKYTIVECGRIRRIYNWLQCFTPEALDSEFADCGLQVVERWGDVAGSPYDAGATEFAVVAGQVRDA